MNLGWDHESSRLPQSIIRSLFGSFEHSIPASQLQLKQLLGWMKKFITFAIDLAPFCFSDLFFVIKVNFSYLV